MANNPHIVAIPFPNQGHIIPLMELCIRLAKNGCRVTFVNTEFNHNRIIEAMNESDDDTDKIIDLVPVPDGLTSNDDRKDIKKLATALNEVIPGKFEALIRQINECDDENRVTCVIADENLDWAQDIAERLGLQGVVFWPAAAATLASMLSVRSLIDDGVVGPNGEVLKKQSIQLSPEMLAMNPEDFWWNCSTNPAVRRGAFELALKSEEAVKSAEFIVCNTAQEMEHGVFSLYPKMLPIGPLLANNRLAKTSGCFWREDSDCLKWLDQQPRSSVVYVAFGSLANFNTEQFRELALGLELTERPFLWVVRPGLIKESSAENVYPEGFVERTRNQGRLVEWAPQQRVLAYPSVGCFLSHCGWNSTVEGLSNGLPFLCWPYFADQFLNKSFVCEVWKIGLGFEKNEDGIVGRHEVKNKVEQLFGDENYRFRALDLQTKVLDSIHKGSSYQNFNNFVNWIKGKK